MTYHFKDEGAEAGANNGLNEEARSVLQAWVMTLPLRAQGTLLTAVRGCDLTPKFPLDSLERRIVAALRYSFLVPADAREVDAEPGCFFSREVPQDFKPSALGHYPLHWVTHVMHAAEVLAYYHPSYPLATKWLNVYKRLAYSLHVMPETAAECHARLTEDRVAAGNIVG
jgi:hypothetical protein